MPPQIRCVYNSIIDNVIEGDFEDHTFTKFVFSNLNKSNTIITVQAYDTDTNTVIPMKKSMLEMPVKTLPENIIGIYTVNGVTTEVKSVKYAGKKNHINAVGCAFIDAHREWNKLNL